MIRCRVLGLKIPAESFISNERQDIVISDDDRKLFLATVGEMGERFAIVIFAYLLIYYNCHM